MPKLGRTRNPTRRTQFQQCLRPNRVKSPVDSGPIEEDLGVPVAELIAQFSTVAPGAGGLPSSFYLPGPADLP